MTTRIEPASAGSRVFQLHFSVGGVASFIKQGDISARISHQTTAMEGIATHQALQKQRESGCLREGGYEREKTVKTCCRIKNRELLISGRADGFCPGSNDSLPWVEEIKTTRLPQVAIPIGIRQQHLNQLRIYAYLICLDESLDKIELRLTYAHPDTLETEVYQETMSQGSLKTHFTKLVEPILQWFEQRTDWLAMRNESLNSLRFPFGEFRPYQRDIAAAIYRNVATEGRLFLQAPTGLGKSMASLYSTLKSLPETQAEKIFYLSAKTAGQASAQEALIRIQSEEPALRSLSITAKRKICFNPEMPCDPAWCQFAEGYYDRLPAALDRVVKSRGHWSKARVEALAREFSLCPFELSLDAAREMDAIVGDYNYFFDPRVRLKRFFDEEQKGRYPILLDEAHNLVDRARDMFSAEIGEATLLPAMQETKTQHKGLYTAFKRIARALTRLGQVSMNSGPEQLLNVIDLEPLVNAITGLLTAMDATAGELPLPETVMKSFFDLHRFHQTYEQLDEDYGCLLSQGDGTRVVKLNCLHPGRRLKKIYPLASSLTAFSATLSPKMYFQEMLGVDEHARWLKSPSPFDARHQATLIVDFIPTHYSARVGSASSLVSLIDQMITLSPGNYLVFFPSYEYLQIVAEQYRSAHPQRPLAVQAPGMGPEAIEGFLAQFQENSVCLGFAVMGGQFSEGIDLQGQRLKGLMVVTLGLAPTSAAQDALAQRLVSDGQSPTILENDVSLRRSGYDFAYRYPALQKVVQTAGRVIRGPEDKGVVILIDARFKESRYIENFPEHWRPEVVKSAMIFEEKLKEFWS